MLRAPNRDHDPTPSLRGLYPLIAAGTLLLGLALAGCGNGDNGDSAGADEFANQISVTCEPYTSELAGLVSPEEEAGGELSFRRYGQLFREGAEITDALLAELRRLKPPESAAPEWDRYLDALTAVNAYRAELGGALGSAFEGKRGPKGLKGLGPEAKVGKEIDEANAEYDEAVEALRRAGISSDCFSEVIGEGRSALEGGR